MAHYSFEKTTHSPNIGMNQAAARYYLIVLYESSFTSSANTITRKPVQQQHKEEENARTEPEMPSAYEISDCVCLPAISRRC